MQKNKAPCLYGNIEIRSSLMKQPYYKNLPLYIFFQLLMIFFAEFLRKCMYFAKTADFMSNEKKIPALSQV